MSTPYMSLDLPVPSSTAGPAYATMNNTAFTTIDSHDHTTGKGVPVPSSGISINADLAFNGNDAITLRSSRYTAQGSPLGAASDLGCTYVAGADLYYNDTAGNQIQLTAGGALNAASIGGIGGDYATSNASVFYTLASTKFTFTQDTNQAAIMDVGPIIIRDVAASANGITLQSPIGLAAGYNVILPAALPAGARFMTLDNSGAVASSWNVDNSTIEVSTNNVQVKDSGIVTAKINNLAVTTAKINDLAVTTGKINDLAVTTGKIANSAVTNLKLAALNRFITSSSGLFTTTNSAFTAVTNLSGSITTVGRAVEVYIVPDNTANESYVKSSSSGATANMRLRITRDGGEIARTNIASSAPQLTVFPTFMVQEEPGAGTFTYAVEVSENSGGGTVTVAYCRLYVKEV